MKRIISIMLAVICSFSIVACGNKTDNLNEQENNSSVEGGTAETEKAEGTESVEGAELRFLDINPSATRQEYYEAAFARIKEEYGINVIYESVPMADSPQKIAIMASTNSLPDIITCNDNNLGAWVNAGYLVPLDSYLNGSEDQFSDTVTKIVWAKQKEVYNSIYTIPDGMMVKGVFVRSDWMEEKGIEVDDKTWTWDDFFKLCEELTDTANNQYGYSYRGARSAMDWILYYLQTFTGGRTYDDDGNCLLKSEECMEAFVEYTDLYKKGYSPKDSINWSFVEMVDGFTGGLCGTLIQDSEVTAMCLDLMQDDEWTVLAMPRGTEDGKLYNHVNAPYSYTISRDCANANAAWTVINYLIQPEENIEYCKLVGEIPIMKEVGDDALYGEGGVYSVFIDQLNDPDLIIPVQYGPWDSTDLQNGPLFEEVQSYLLDEQSAEAALGNICDMLENGMKDYLDKNPGSVVETPKSME